MGRLGVDIYRADGVSLRKVETFGKTWAARRPTSRSPPRGTAGRSALISRTGADPFGEYLHDALRGFGVDDRHVTP